MSSIRTDCFFFNDTAATEIYTLSLHDALPILLRAFARPHGPVVSPDGRIAPCNRVGRHPKRLSGAVHHLGRLRPQHLATRRSEEHTSELQSRQYLVCRLLLEKKKKL